MRILVATTYTIPGYSGGWTTPLDLFGSDHQAMYVVRNYPPVTRTIEGIRVAGAGGFAFLSRKWNRGERFRRAFLRRTFRWMLQRHFKAFRADFILCLDPAAGYDAMSTGLPYAMRFHSRVDGKSRGPDFRGLLRKALFNIACPNTDVPGTEVIPHNQDLTRFHYNEASRAERAILLTSIDDIHEPDLFIEGIMRSAKMRGDIVGTGPERKRISDACRRTGGRVRCLPPVPRLHVPELLSDYQVGIATVRQVAPVLYQMKVNAYMASGLMTLVKPWTHIAHEAPELVRTFITSEDLAEELDRLSDHWEDTLEIRRQARGWINESYSVLPARIRFNEILEDKVVPVIGGKAR